MITFIGDKKFSIVCSFSQLSICQKYYSMMAEKEKFDISSLVSKDITELTASDARSGLDQFLLRSSGDVVDAGIKCKLAGEDEIVGDFAFMISDKVGGILTLLYHL